MYIERTAPSRKFPKGGYKATYRGPDGKEHSKTWAKRGDAENWAAGQQVSRAKGEWVDPAAGRITFEKWFEDWMATVTIRRSTRDLYDYLGRRHLLPTFGRAELVKITTTDVRRWLAATRSTKLSPNTVAKAYRLLARVMRTAVDDGLIARSPCTIEGAGKEISPEQRFASVAEIYALADAVDPRYRALVLAAPFAGARWGELAGLRQRRLDLLHKTLQVSKQLTEVNGHLELDEDPKTEAAKRTVALPAFLADELRHHLEHYAEPGPDGLVFPAPEGGPMRRSNFRRRVWVPATKTAGVEGLRFHDLRHSAGTLAAQEGATTKELMARLGHASPRAALIYQHATAERDAELAARLDRLAASSRPEAAGADVAQVATLR